MGGDSFYGGKGGGEPAHKLGVLLVLGNCCLPVSGSAPIAYCLAGERAQQLASEASCMQSSC